MDNELIRIAILAGLVLLILILIVLNKKEQNRIDHEEEVEFMVEATQYFERKKEGKV